MQLVELELHSIQKVEIEGKETYALVLLEKDKEKPKQLGIIVENFQARAIAFCMENLEDETKAPMVYRTIINLVKASDLELDKILLEGNQEEKRYQTKLVLQKEEKTIELAAQVTDAIAVAIYGKCPIYTSQTTLNEFGLKTA